MRKLRVYQVAEQLGVDKKAIVAQFQRAGAQAIRNYMSVVEREDLERLRELVELSPEILVSADDRRKRARAPGTGPAVKLPPAGSRGCFWTERPLAAPVKTLLWRQAGILSVVGPDVWLELRDAQIGLLGEVFELLPDHEALLASRARVFHLDLSELAVGYPSMVAPLCSWLAVEAEWLRGRVLNLVPPKAKSVARWLDDIGFTDSVLMETHARRERAVSMALSEIKPDDADAGYKISDKLRALIRNNHIPITDEALNSLGIATSEIIENSLRHAKMTSSGYACAQVHPASSKLSICIADAGVGIAETFKTAPYRPARERFLAGESPLALAIEPLMSSKYGMGHSGYGLFYASTLCELAHGTFVLSSGGESYVAHPNDRNYERHSGWRGTIVNILLDTCSPIDGRRVWERLPMAHDGDQRGVYADAGTLPVSLNLGAIGTQLYTRDKARFARESIQPNPDGRIVISFDGVIVMTPSFADELFGSLYAVFGATNYAQKVVVVDADPYMIELIEMVLLHREQGPKLLGDHGASSA